MSTNTIEDPVQRVVDLHLNILRGHGIEIRKDAVILDFGCGSGRHVYEHLDRGFENIFGFDIKTYVDLRDQADQERFRFGEMRPNSPLPFENNTFDYVYSTSVFEHVIEQEAMYREVYRVLKPGGIFLNNFPSKWRPIEPHIFVPFGGATRSYLYFIFWAFLGIRNSFQKGDTALVTAKKNHGYAHNGLRYLSFREVDQLLASIFDSHTYVEMAFIRHSTGRSKKLFWLVNRFPFLLYFYRRLHTHVVILRKTVEDFSGR